MKKEDIQIGDWVIATAMYLVPLDIDASTYEGLPAIVTEIIGESVKVYSPLKLCHGKPPVDEIPFCQLVKLEQKSAEEFVERIRSTPTYNMSRARLGDEECFQAILSEMESKGLDTTFVTQEFEKKV
jgi:hypothetical protein